ncbi:flagellar protein FlhE [Erwiniaceae bacterium BAC15a-03b]|uniref:Flagellar protein FlhE n=1 Tax=Winslowiella arboricola TaxID=2978220 RepID=A0A9J6PHS2_9GAMM|nr:flagellar protein FlhE [Winslowiella arboricola]MCU5773032.1 flagellar protein FlhE [Winslowiella arboricola]MCU5777873.1 flagellar protein FlhE [Winslowiella arboricola]
MINSSRCILLLSLLSCGVSAAAANSGSSMAILHGAMSVGVANNIYKNNFVLNSAPLPQATVTKVFWNYSLAQSQIPAGGTLQVYLCQGSTSNCVDISSAQNGTTSYFSGKVAQMPFYLYYRVNGRVPMRYVQGRGDTQLSINWEVR